jgi:hypothetical protein
MGRLSSVKLTLLTFFVLASSVVFVVPTYVRNLKHTRLKIVPVTATSRRLVSFFDGLTPDHRYVGGKLYADDRAHRTSFSRCQKPTSILDRISATLGIEVKAQAQGGCGPFFCSGCYISLDTTTCAGSGCNSGSQTGGVSGGPCSAGLYTTGMACNGECGCNYALCPNAQHCGCT